MSKTFSIEYEWTQATHGASPEQATRAEISVWARDVCLTENMDRTQGSQRQSARLPALHLSRWLAANWWRLTWEPYDARATRGWQMSHRMGATGGGHLWPDISFSSDWNTVLVRSKPTIPRAAEPIRYSRECNHFIPADSFQEKMENFVASTIERLRQVAPTHGELEELWEEITNEKNDPEYAQWRRLEACLGYEPDEAPEELMKSLFAEYNRYGANVIHELAAASKNDSLRHLQAVTENIQSRGSSVQVPQYDEIRAILSNPAGDREELPWQRATRTARIARDA